MNHKQFLEKLKSNNQSYRDGEFEVIKEHISGEKKVLVKDKYGICEVGTWELLKGSTSSITSALDKDAYCINVITENINTNYDYSKVIYVNQKTKIEIVCEKHGSFWQVPYAHKKGHGCKQCALEERIISLEDFKKYLIENNFDKSRQINIKEFRGKQSILEIVCKEGHLYETNSSDRHNSQNSCPHCHRLYLFISNNKEVDENTNIIFYVFILRSKNEQFYKIGITKNIKNRIKNIESKSSYKVEVVYEQEMNLKAAYDQEQYFINYFKEFKKYPEERFGGYTECLTENPINLENWLHEDYENRREEYINNPL